MRTIIDITQEQVKALDEISELEGTSRAALIRQAIDRMLAGDARRGESAQAAFGLWSGRKESRESSVVSRQQDRQPVIEDAFVTAPAPEPDKIPEPVAPAEPVVAAPPVREASMTTVDPLSAFFAGVKP